MKLLEGGLVDASDKEDCIVGPQGELFLRMSYQIRPNIKHPDVAVIDIMSTTQEQLESCYPHVLIEDKYVMEQGDFMLGMTEARVNMPNDHIGDFSDYMFIRVGEKMVEVVGFHSQFASLVDPGFRGNLVLEMKNLVGSEMLIEPSSTYAMMRLTPIVGADHDQGYSGQYERQGTIQLPNLRTMG